MTLSQAREHGARRRSTMRHLSALCAIVLMGSPALLRAVDIAAPAWQGVWKGAIGTLPVRVRVCVCVCVKSDGAGPGSAFGFYYYLSKLNTVRLEQQETSEAWFEGWAAPKGPQALRWNFAKVSHDRLTGT